jgi:hypothetical protein
VVIKHAQNESRGNSRPTLPKIISSAPAPMHIQGNSSGLIFFSVNGVSL